MGGMRSGLPAATNRLIARDADVAGLIDGLRTARLVTVTGPGGVGKTRLALKVARELDPGTGMTALIDLSQLEDPARVAAVVAEAVGAAGVGEKIDDVARYLADLEVLLVVDNCEHVQDVAASMILALLERCPRLRVLATSRETLRLPGELVWTLRPLASDDAAELFIERAEALRPGAGADRAAIEEICARLDGVPLAIELAAGRTSSLSAATILARLEDHAGLLATSARGTPRRHRSLRAAIEWSVELLSEPERQAFTRLAMFPGSFSLEAGEAVAEMELDVIDELVAKSLLSVTAGSEGEVRYRLLDTIRTYGRELLGATHEEHGRLRTRHLAFYVDLAERVQAANALGGSDADVRMLSGELHNLRMALDWAEQRDPPSGLRLIGAGREAWFARSETEGRERAARLLALHPTADRPRALGLLCGGRLAVAHQDHEPAAAMLSEAAQLARAVDERAILACALHYLGISGMLARDLQAAASHLNASTTLFVELGQQQGVGRGLGVLGFVHLYQGKRADAQRIFQEALAIVEASDDAWGVGQVSLGLGLTAKGAGDAAAAIAHLSRSIVSLVAAGDATILGVALSTLGALTLEDDPRRAVRFAAATTAFRARIGGEYPAGTIAELQAIRDRATERLGQAEVDAEWETGLRLTPVSVAELIEPEPRRRADGPLTARQREVAALVAEGLTNAQIAARLHLSERTIENHVYGAIGALGIHNRVQLATWVAQQDATTAAF